MIPGSPPDRLAGLNDAERRILRLLGEGHTAKTIAAELDCGVGSVNERLREARRKTGVGSSRELARLLREQEIRHEQIGVAAGVGTRAATDPYPVGDGRRWGRKGLAMGVFAVAATVAALSFLVTQESVDPSPDPVVAAALPRGAGPRELHAQFLAEQRDVAWADSTERALRAQYAKIEGIASGSGLSVSCARTLCEVAGSFGPLLSQRQANRIMSDLHAPRLEEAKAIGLKMSSAGFGSIPGDPKRSSFIIYYARDGGASGA